MLEKIKKLSSYTKTMNILYVEDDPIALEVMSELLNELFAKVIMAKNGQEALDYFKTHQDIQLIITDVHMPKMDGIELVNQLHEIDKNINIIMLTQYDDVKQLITKKALQIDEYVLKPINFDKLLDAIEKIVANNTMK